MYFDKTTVLYLEWKSLCWNFWNRPQRFEGHRPGSVLWTFFEGSIDFWFVLESVVCHNFSVPFFVVPLVGWAMTDKGIQLHSKWTFLVYADGNPECSPYSHARSTRSGSQSPTPTPSGTVLGTFSTVQVCNHFYFVHNRIFGGIGITLIWGLSLNTPISNSSNTISQVIMMNQASMTMVGSGYGQSETFGSSLGDHPIFSWRSAKDVATLYSCTHWWTVWTSQRNGGTFSFLCWHV